MISTAENIEEHKITSLVSVIIPVYNCERFVAQALDSTLNQTYPNIEIIVVDDGSTDSTPRILDGYQDRDNVAIVHHENSVNKGVSYSRQLGISFSQGEYIAFLDADDIFMPKKIGVQLGLLRNNPDAILCHSAIEPVCEDGLEIDGSHFQLADEVYKYEYKKEKYFLKQNRICNSTTLVKGSAVKGLKFAGKQLFQFEDWLLWIMLFDKGKFCFTPEKLVKYRYSKESATYRVVENSLVDTYSHVEFYFKLLARDVSRHVKLKAIVLLIKSMLRLYRQYSLREIRSSRGQ